MTCKLAAATGFGSHKIFTKGSFRCVRPFLEVQAVQLGKTIYVLHAFQKKASTGIKTSQKDIDLIRQRYNEAKELAKDE